MGTRGSLPVRFCEAGRENTRQPGGEPRNLKLWSRPAANCRQRLEDLTQRQVLTPENVAFAHAATLAGQPMALRGLARIHDIQSRVDVGGHGAAQKIYDGLARRSRLNVVLANRSRGIHNHHRQPGSHVLQSNLLGPKLRLLIGAGHVREAHGSGLVAQTALHESDATDGAGVNHPLDASLARGFQHIARAIHVRPEHLRGIADPQPVVGGNVKHQATARHRALHGRGVTQIPLNEFRLQVFHGFGFSHQCPNWNVVLPKHLGNVPAQKARSAGDQGRASCAPPAGSQWIGRYRRFAQRLEAHARPPAAPDGSKPASSSFTFRNSASASTGKLSR